MNAVCVYGHRSFFVHLRRCHERILKWPHQAFEDTPRLLRSFFFVVAFICSPLISFFYYYFAIQRTALNRTEMLWPEIGCSCCRKRKGRGKNREMAHRCKEFLLVKIWTMGRGRNIGRVRLVYGNHPAVDNHFLPIYSNLPALKWRKRVGWGPFSEHIALSFTCNMFSLMSACFHRGRDLRQNSGRKKDGLWQSEFSQVPTLRRLQMSVPTG